MNTQQKTRKLLIYQEKLKNLSFDQTKLYSLNAKNDDSSIDLRVSTVKKNLDSLINSVIEEQEEIHNKIIELLDTVEVENNDDSNID